MLQSQRADAMMRVAGRLAGAGALESVPSLAVAELDSLRHVERLVGKALAENVARALADMRSASSVQLPREYRMLGPSPSTGGSSTAFHSPAGLVLRVFEQSVFPYSFMGCNTQCGVIVLWFLSSFSGEECKAAGKRRQDP